MKTSVEMLKVVPPGILFGMIRKKFSNIAKFQAKSAVITANYINGTFQIIITGAEPGQEKEANGKIEDFTEFSEILISRVQKQIAADEIKKFVMKIDLQEKKTVTEIWYLSNFEGCYQILNSLF